MMRHPRSGMVLGICCLVLVLLGLMVATIHMLSRQSYTELKRVDGFLRAVAVGESAFTRLLARLESEPWDRRWFKDAADVGSGTWEDGRYDYLIGNAPSTLEADLLVRATADRSTVTMLWRLRADPATLAPHRRLRTIYFGYGDPTLAPGPGVLGPIDAAIDGSISIREQNRPWANEKEIELKGIPGLPGVGTLLGLPGTPVIADVLLPPAPGASPRPQEPVLSSAPPPPPIPTFPPPDLGGLPIPATAVAVAEGMEDMEKTLFDVDAEINKLNRVLGGVAFQPPMRLEEQSTFIQTEERLRIALAECDANPTTCTDEQKTAITKCGDNIAQIHGTYRGEFKTLYEKFYTTKDRAARVRARLEELRNGGTATESLLQELRAEARSVVQEAKAAMENVTRIDTAVRQLLGGVPCGAYSGL